jgi:phospholipase/carboxylesterase
MPNLIFEERPAASDPVGLLILHHGRGTSEQDLLPLADLLDPQQRLHVAAPRGPLELPGAPGYHWYTVPRVGHPDPQTFDGAYRQLAAFHDELWERTGLTPQQTILGGFSMGTVMSYALGLGPDRPAPGGILAFSGFIPTVEGWSPDLTASDETRVFISHGRWDPVINVAFGQTARDLLVEAGFQVDYRESDADHSISPDELRRAVPWLATTLGA